MTIGNASFYTRLPYCNWQHFKPNVMVSISFIVFFGGGGLFFIIRFRCLQYLAYLLRKFCFSGNTYICMLSSTVKNFQCYKFLQLHYCGLWWASDEFSFQVPHWDTPPFQTDVHLFITTVIILGICIIIRSLCFVCFHWLFISCKSQNNNN